MGAATTWTPNVHKVMSLKLKRRPEHCFAYFRGPGMVEGLGFRV